LIFEYGPPLTVARYTLYPVIEVDVLAFQDKSTVCGIVAPVPLAVSEAEVEVLVKKEMLAEALPVAVGAKVTVKGILCPAEMVTGKVSPPSVNWELLELADDRVILPPLAVTLPFWLRVLPMVIVLKLMDKGVTPNVLLELVALPERPT
jgi:hypothetical protein